MINQLRHILVEWLLRLIIAIVPEDEDGILLIRQINFFSSVMLKRLKARGT